MKELGQEDNGMGEGTCVSCTRNRVREGPRLDAVKELREVILYQKVINL